jgi:hypothetical protein
MPADLRKAFGLPEDLLLDLLCSICWAQPLNNYLETKAAERFRKSDGVAAA